MKMSKREQAHKNALKKDSTKPGKFKSTSHHSAWTYTQPYDPQRRNYYGDVLNMVNDYVREKRWKSTHSPIHFVLKMESQYTNGRELAEQACDIVESPLYQAMNESTVQDDLPWQREYATSLGGEWVISNSIYSTSSLGTYITFTNGSTIKVP